MELKITTLDGEAKGSVDLSDTIFGLEPRQDLIQRCVVWQLAKRRAGTHKVKGRAEIWRTGKKMYKQKGTGGARHGSQRANLFRGGGVHSVRWCAAMRSTCPKRCAFLPSSMRSPLRPKTAGSSSLKTPSSRRPKLR